jgi:hemolysin activation/secretion protein
MAAVETQKFTLRLTVAAGAGEFIERNIFGTVYNDHVRTLDAIADSTFTDTLSGRDYLTLLFRQGFPILGASPLNDQFPSHFGASGLFSIADFAFTRYQNLNDAWSIKLAAAGQLASAPLFLSQQFYLGGFAFGRGYDAGVISGDNGIAGTAEIRYDGSVTNYQPLTGLQLYGFVDSGATWDHNNDEGILSLVSVGIGTR